MKRIGDVFVSGAGESSPSFSVQEKNSERISGHAKFFAEFFKARMPRLKKLGEEFGATSKTRPDCLAHPEQLDRFVPGAPAHSAEFLRPRQIPGLNVRRAQQSSQSF